MIKEFRDFLLRGNLVDTAVGIVIGLAFAAVITALVADLITPLIAAIGGQPDFAGSRSRSTRATSSTGRSSTR
jgi:large conductance mechanosensitive channel